VILAVLLHAVASFQKPDAAASPGPRRALALACDERRDCIVLFGGASDRAETWTLNGKAWTRLELRGPDARRGAAFVFDAKRGRCVLVGGSRGDDPTSPCFDETWTFDGKEWTKSAVSIGVRSHFACAYDRKRERVVLVGGMDPGTGKGLDDVLEWDGASWSTSAVRAPGALFAPQMAYDEKSNVLVLTSSRPSDRKLTTWTFDGKAFSKVDEDGPAVILSGQSLATLGPGGGVLLFGGFDTSPVADTWTWDGKTWKKLDAHGPPARLAHALAYDRRRGRIVLYGGEDGKQTFDDLWEFGKGTWNAVR
jgi:hypothetical protein